MERLSRFLRSLWWLRGRRSLVTVHNVRALWAQSDPRWLDKQRIDMSDEEAEAFIRACRGLDS